MSGLAPVFLFISAVCLAAIQLRKPERWGYAGFFSKKVRDEFDKPLDSSDKKLALVALASLAIGVALLFIGA
jgi:hypothetical protein